MYKNSEVDKVMEGDLINNRIQQMIEEYSQLAQSRFCDPPSFEVLNDEGDIKMTIWGFTKDGRKLSAEKIFALTDDISNISDLFVYPDYIDKSSKDIYYKGVRTSYFDTDGNLIVEHADKSGGGTERFKIREKHRDETISKLKDLLKDKLKYNV